VLVNTELRDTKLSYDEQTIDQVDIGFIVTEVLPGAKVERSCDLNVTLELNSSTYIKVKYSEYPALLAVTHRLIFKLSKYNSKYLLELNLPSEIPSYKWTGFPQTVIKLRILINKFG